MTKSRQAEPEAAAAWNGNDKSLFKTQHAIDVQRKQGNTTCSIQPLHNTSLANAHVKTSHPGQIDSPDQDDVRDLNTSASSKWAVIDLLYY